MRTPLFPPPAATVTTASRLPVPSARRALLRALSTSLVIGLLSASGVFAANLGEECKMGTNVAASYLCPMGTVCLQSIGKKYCSNPGMVCGWGGTSGYPLGQEKTYQGKQYECTPTGFKRAKAAVGEECRTGNNVPRQYLCETGKICLQSIDEKFCSNPGMVCGWAGTSGFPLGEERSHEGRTWECTATGFEVPEKAFVQVRGVTTIPTNPKIRRLSSAEIRVARSVFGRSLDFSQVRVTNTVGSSSKPWTTNTPPIYTINIGVEAYESLATETWSGLLIHELAHVWQGQHGVPFVSNSAVHQALSAIENGGDTSNAYDFAAGRQWNKYNVEQQASIVEKWFTSGKQRSSPLYPYIRDNVLPGRPNAVTRVD